MKSLVLLALLSVGFCQKQTLPGKVLRCYECKAQTQAGVASNCYTDQSDPGTKITCQEDDDVCYKEITGSFFKSIKIFEFLCQKFEKIVFIKIQMKKMIFKIRIEKYFRNPNIKRKRFSKYELRKKPCSLISKS